MFCGSTKVISVPVHIERYSSNVYSYDPINERFAMGRAMFYQQHDHADIGTNASLEAKYKLLQSNYEKIMTAAKEFSEGISAIEELVHDIPTTDPDRTFAFIDETLRASKGSISSSAFERLLNVADSIKREISRVLDGHICKEYMDNLSPEELDILQDNAQVLQLLKKDAFLFPVAEGKESFSRLLTDKRVQNAWPLIRKMSMELYEKMIPAALESVIASYRNNVEKISEFYGPILFVPMIEEFCEVLLKKKTTFAWAKDFYPDIDGILKDNRTLPLLIKEVGEVLARECRRLQSCSAFTGRTVFQNNPRAIESICRRFNFADEIENVAQFVANVVDHRHVSHTAPSGDAAIIFATDLSPVEYASLSMSTRGIVCARGNTISHTAIMAKGSDIAYVVNRTIQTQLLVSEGDLVLINPLKGEIIIEPSPEQLASFYEDKKRYQREVEINNEAKSFAVGKRTYSLDGQRVEMSVIANSYKDINDTIELNKGKGANIGLLRTELLTDYGETHALPTMEEYFMFYMKAVSAVSERIDIRTLDLNDTDKKSYRGISSQGLSGIAYDLAHPENLKNQIKAILHCALLVPEKSINVIFPQIEMADQVVQTKGLVDQAVQELAAEHAGLVQIPGNISFGIMLETMELVKDSFCELKKIIELDWISCVKIGGNDLLCSVLGKARDSVTDQDFFDHTHIQTLADVIGFLQGLKTIRFSYCGQAASHKDRLPVLIGLGLQKFAVTISNYYYLKQSVMYEVNVKNWREQLFGLISSDMTPAQIQNTLVPPLHTEMKENYAKQVLDMLLQAKEQTRKEQSLVATQIEMNKKLTDLSSKLNHDNIILERFRKMVSYVNEDLLNNYVDTFDEDDMVLVFPALLWRYSEVDSFLLDPEEGFGLPQYKTSFRRKDARAKNVVQKYKGPEEYTEYFTSETYINKILRAPLSHIRRNKKLTNIDKVLLAHATPLFLDTVETLRSKIENGGFLKGSNGNVFVFFDEPQTQVIGVCIKDVRSFAGELSLVSEMEDIENGSVVFWKFPQDQERMRILKYSREIDSIGLIALGSADNNSVFPRSIDRENPYFYASISADIASHIRMFQRFNVLNKMMITMKEGH